MKVPLLCQWSGDGDIAAAFLRHYIRWVSEFHLILHGSEEANQVIVDLRRSFPIVIHDRYEGRFDDEEKKRRLNDLAAKFREQWLLVVDSDEFLELPYDTMDDAICNLEQFGFTYMAAPMLQRFRADCSLDSPEIVNEISDEFPMCSERLYELMGNVTGLTTKFPLFRCTAASTIGIGHHLPPNQVCPDNQISGVSHHFKWRSSAISRIAARIEEKWPWAETESVFYLRYLEENGMKLPANGAFRYSREELFKRELLKV